MESVRTEYGFEPTVCGCHACVRQCEHISGQLVPEDLPRWRAHFGARENIELSRVLLASPGALVGTHDGQVFRIRTIVPDRRESGACAFLNSERRCTIHPLAPYGCRFFDEHMSDIDRETRSRRGLVEIMKDWREGGAYACLWHQLHAQGRIAEAPEVLRARIERCQTNNP